MKIFKMYTHKYNYMKIEVNSTEEKIIKATYQILNEEGARKTTTKKIAASAGVNEVTIFRKFDTKNNLIDITKEYHMNLFLDKINKIFDYTEDEEIDIYLQKNFQGVLSLTEDDWAIIKIGMEEFRDDESSEDKLLIKITDTVFAKLRGFFELQKEKGNIKDINLDVLCAMTYSVTFQTLMLWRIYNRTPDHEKDDFYGQEYLNILYHGIKPE